MQRRLVYTDDLMRHLTTEYNRKHTNDGLGLAWIEKAVNDTPTADVEAGDDEKSDD